MILCFLSLPELFGETVSSSAAVCVFANSQRFFSWQLFEIRYFLVLCTIMLLFFNIILTFIDINKILDWVLIFT